MAPLEATEDYYMILQVEQTATVQIITRAYKRLALELHPDRNAQADATQAFQRLGRAYETLKDEGKRREYDFIYPSIARARPTAAPKTESPNEAAQIVAIQISQRERNARWQTDRNTFESSIFELQRAINRLQQEIKALDTIAAAEAAAEAQKNSWSTWLLSPIYKKVEESEEEKAHKDRERQERRIQKDMKDRRLDWTKADLKKVQACLQKAREVFETANSDDDRKIEQIHAKIRLREWQEREQARKEREKQEEEARKQRAKEEEERWAAFRREQEKAAEALRKERQQAAEAARKRQAEIRAAEQRRREEEARKRWNPRNNTTRDPFTQSAYSKSTFQQACYHAGWWPKVQGRKACRECDDIWTYLLQCPDCDLMVCPKCQAELRPRRRNRRADQ